MAGGLLSTGLGYEQNAVSGMVRSSALQQEVDTHNEQVQAAEKQQTMQMVSEGAGLATALMFAFLF